MKTPSRLTARYYTTGLIARLLLTLLLTAAFAQAATTAPDWVKTIADKPALLKYGKADTAILLEDKVIDIDADGTFTHRLRVVKRLITADGKADARAILPYNTSACRVKSFRAWLLRPKGPVLIYDKDKIVDIATYGTALELYGEGRRKTISAVHDAEVGSVFAYEAVWEEKSIHSQIGWSFALSAPVECSRLTLNLAEGWKVESRTFNHDPVQPIVSGNNTTWELRQIPAARKELHAPEPSATQPWIGVNIIPPATAKNNCRFPLFSWESIITHWSPVYDKAAAPDDAIKTKATELCAGTTGLRERIERLCLYVQKTNYISIHLNAAEGGGIIPQPATKSFRYNYGDCKDKATLLRAMLKTQDIESYQVIVYAGDHHRLKPDWPSSGQFNHCILAIKVDDSIEAKSIYTHPKLGRFVIFDPTHPYVPFGTLPRPDCGGFGMLFAGSDGCLIKLPAIEPSVENTSVSTRLTADGTLSGTIAHRFTGPAADQLRSSQRSLKPTDFSKNIRQRLENDLPVLEIKNISPTDDFANASFSLNLDFSAVGYGKRMQTTLLVFKPILNRSSQRLPLLKVRRTLPVLIDPFLLTETSRISLPEGFVVDELPKPVELKSAIGSYSSAIRIDDKNDLILERTLQLKEATVPASDYAEIRTFAEQISEAEQSPVVLKRKPI